jgi:hypothetical protein
VTAVLKLKYHQKQQAEEDNYLEVRAENAKVKGNLRIKL